MGRGHLWRAREAFYVLADGSSEFYHTLNDFLRWVRREELKLASTLRKQLLIPVHKISKVRERGDSYLTSDPGVYDGVEIVGLMSTHVDGLLLVADDTTRELVGQVLGIRLDSPRHRSPPFAHCGLPVLENRGSLQMDQSSYNLGVGPIDRDGHLPSNSLAGGSALDPVWRKNWPADVCGLRLAAGRSSKSWRIGALRNRSTNSHAAISTNPQIDLREKIDETRLIFRKDLNLEKPI